MEKTKRAIQAFAIKPLDKAHQEMASLVSGEKSPGKFITGVNVESDSHSDGLGFNLTLTHDIEGVELIDGEAIDYQASVISEYKMRGQVRDGVFQLKNLEYNHETSEVEFARVSRDISITSPEGLNLTDKQLDKIQDGIERGALKDLGLSLNSSDKSPSLNVMLSEAADLTVKKTSGLKR